MELPHLSGIMNDWYVSDIFPDELLDETRRTLDVLLPRFNPISTNWFRRQAGTKELLSRPKAPRIDPAVAKSNSLTVAERNTGSFDFFRDRMVILKEEYDAHEPRNLTQYWHDYRKPAQWWALWVAVVVFIFGLSQVIEGAIQCYKAYHLI
jgi:hypothetical protein